MLDGIIRDVQKPRDLVVAQPARRQLRDLALTVGERFFELRHIVQHGENAALVGAGVVDAERLDLPDRLRVARRDGRQQKQHLKIFAEAGEEGVVFVLLRNGERAVEPLRGFSELPDGKVAQRETAVHKILRRGGDEPRVQLQRCLDRRDGALIFLPEQQIGNAAGLDHEVCERQVGQRIRRALRPERGAVRLHHQPQQIPAHGLGHACAEARAVQKCVALRLVFQILHRALQSRHVGAVDGVDAEQQRRAVGGGGILRLLRQKRRLIRLNVRLLKAPLHGVCLAPVDLRHPGGVTARETIIAPQHDRQPRRRGHHLPRLGVEQIPHRGTAEEKRLFGDKQLRFVRQQLFRARIRRVHTAKLREKFQRVQKLPLAEQMLVAQFLQKRAQRRHLRGKLCKVTSRVQRVAQPQQRQGIAPPDLLRAAAQHGLGDVRIAHAGKILCDETDKTAGKQPLVVLCLEKAIYRRARRAVITIPDTRAGVDLAPQCRGSLRQPRPQKMQQQLVGIVAVARGVVPHERRAAEQLFPRAAVERAIRQKAA